MTYMTMTRNMPIGMIEFICRECEGEMTLDTRHPEESIIITQKPVPVFKKGKRLVFAPATPTICRCGRVMHDSHCIRCDDITLGSIEGEAHD